jgi:hypothetical protein
MKPAIPVVRVWVFGGSLTQDPYPYPYPDTRTGSQTRDEHYVLEGFERSSDYEAIWKA